MFLSLFHPTLWKEKSDMEDIRYVLTFPDHGFSLVDFNETKALQMGADLYHELTTLRSHYW